MEVPAKLQDTKKYQQVSKSPVISEMFSNCSYVLVCQFGRGASPLDMKGETKTSRKCLVTLVWLKLWSCQIVDGMLEKFMTWNKTVELGKWIQYHLLRFHETFIRDICCHWVVQWVHPPHFRQILDYWYIIIPVFVEIGASILGCPWYLVNRL